MTELEHSKIYFGSAFILFQDLKRHLFSIFPQLLAFFSEAADSTSEATAVLGAAVRNVMEDTKGTFTPAVVFCPDRAAYTAQFVPYCFFHRCNILQNSV